MKKVQASAIATFLGKPLVGQDLELKKPMPLSRNIEGALLFAKSYTEEMCAQLNTCSQSLVLALPEYSAQLKIPHIISANPRLDFARVVQAFFVNPEIPHIATSAVIDPSAKLGRGVSIGEFTVIGAGAEIGDQTFIGHQVVVSKGVKIGCHCTVKSGTIIGEKGFGFEYDTEGCPIPLPHIGSVVVGDHVEIGANCTVVAGTLTHTMIGDHVKTDDQVHIAHNVQIGRGAAIAACAEISGSVRIGERVWLGPNCSVIDGIEIGSDAYVGIGAVVIKDIPASKVVVGNPARVLRDVEKKV